MKLRPCIDIHNGTVKQIVGSTINDEHASDNPLENFQSVMGAAHFAGIFKEKGLKGGHVINLNKRDTGFFAASENEVFSALSAYPGGMAAGGGIGPDNAKDYLDKGAEKVIVTSYIFEFGNISLTRLRELDKAIGPRRLVIDLSCKSDGKDYYVYTDRWQTKTKTKVNMALFEKLHGYCSEFLIHGISVEGKRQGFDEELIRLLSDIAPLSKPITYAGGIGSLDDIKKLKEITNNIDITVGSALSIYGGDIDLDEVIEALS